MKAKTKSGKERKLTVWEKETSRIWSLWGQKEGMRRNPWVLERRRVAWKMGRRCAWRRMPGASPCSPFKPNQTKPEGNLFFFFFFFFVNFLRMRFIRGICGWVCWCEMHRFISLYLTHNIRVYVCDTTSFASHCLPRCRGHPKLIPNVRAYAHDITPLALTMGSAVQSLFSHYPLLTTLRDSFTHLL